MAETVRQQVLGLLRELGMMTIFGNPGSTELPMFRDFPADFRYVLGLQEAVVVGMADGYAQATGRAAFVNLHSAAGVGNAMGAIFTASRNRTPLVITAGQQARRLLPFDPFLGSTRAAELPMPHVKWSCEPARPEDVGVAIQRAWLVASQPPYGPTFVSVPLDDWDRPAGPLPQRRTLAGPGATSLEGLRWLGERLDGAARPAFVIGAQLDDAAGWSLAVLLAERHGAAVWAPPMYGRCAFPEDHPLFAGHLPARPEALRDRLAGHDLVLVLGAPAFTYHVDGEPPYVPDGTDLILVSDDSEHAASMVGGTALTGRCHDMIAALLTRREPPSRAKPEPRPRPSAPADDRLTGARIVALLEAIRPADSIIVEEAPTTREDIQHHLRVRRPGGFHACASGGLGFGLSAAVGVALASPGTQVIAVIGDGSSMYALPALWSAAQLGVALKILIVNNGGYAALDRFARLFELEAQGTRLPGLDFVKLAEGQGVPARRVEAAAALAPEMADWLAHEGPCLLEVRLDRPDAVMP